MGEGGEWRASGNFRGAIGHGTYKHFLMILGDFSEKRDCLFGENVLSLLGRTLGGGDREISGILGRTFWDSWDEFFRYLFLSFRVT